ncbi:LuxR C-terminal-related transcriptional regulator [Vibrio sp. SCSIO 43136]|uniref:LuxR C-terminal-related transcriptional regulator n=1 Tax=Vibrio sp. SCSIO 43136 TaxID=2819101 RepID=UPI0020765D3C|nr:LuxR C-terminal-related transcriptional regulator [Vibrio sp. SCSIO 43136]USD67153.1 helix-turn-helix transcriptional regulator [Vibrio sp. SCSIO 43136]
MNLDTSSNVRAVLLADNSLQSMLLKESIEKETHLTIKLVSPDKLVESRYYSADALPEIVLIDLSSCKGETIDTYYEFRSQFFPDVKEVLLNCQSEVHCKEVLKWRNLVGVFYATDSLETLIQGIDAILEGELWLSRKLTHEYIKFYRNRQGSSTTSDYAVLTKREQQIIKMLGEGASNIEIADALFVSENTVKTHLHNAFKKIKVKNRLQALLWVKENIGSEEFIERA